jgi:hypothetical protein
MSSSAQIVAKVRSLPFSALSPVQRELYLFAVAQIKAKGLSVREPHTYGRILRLIFGDRALSAYDLHNRPAPVRRRPKRIERRPTGRVG